MVQSTPRPRSRSYTQVREGGRRGLTPTPLPVNGYDRVIYDRERGYIIMTGSIHMFNNIIIIRAFRELIEDRRKGPSRFHLNSLRMLIIFRTYYQKSFKICISHSLTLPRFLPAH